jgi:hypothetical protein
MLLMGFLEPLQLLAYDRFVAAADMALAVQEIDLVSALFI